MLPFWPAVWIVLGGLSGAVAVGMAAAAAHALPQRLDASGLAAVNSAIQMQGWHALALIATALFMLRAGPLPSAVGNLAAAAFAVGTLLFCGAIYGHHLAGWRTGPVAPIGGIALIAGWLLLAFAALLAGRAL